MHADPASNLNADWQSAGRRVYKLGVRIVVRMARTGIEVETVNEATGKHATDGVEWTEILKLDPE